MKKKAKHILITVLAAIFLVACSKDEDSPAPEVAVKTLTPMPTIVSLVYSTGRTIRYTMDYNDSLQLTTIDMSYKTDDGENTLETEIRYNETGSITTINVVDVKNSLNYVTTFDYDPNNDISDIAFMINGDVQPTMYEFDPDNHIYKLDGDLGNFPMGWGFDQDNQLTEMVINDNYFKLTASGNEKGVFHNLDPQPALTIWYGLLFYLSHYELYFFHQKDLVRFESVTFFYDYKEKVRDGDGNLIAFKMVPNDPLAGTISYTVSYKGY
ncbi:hypothetical protein HPE56_07315 [Maribacter sp. ANRC-HE7]|uniref:DUF4595 domain-containing protein n=1 Tax=Maribacter aquimaris TaxID=2737171 RepID=A0ABR7UYC8_9FLAO|nr:hypothetical protein [Maribacter aquimaris]MBD0777597.1 hypothetical protein [Maribacter aquimaris]